MQCRIFYHDHCFDGACSASVFSRFHRECVRAGVEYSYSGLMHRAGSLFDESSFVDGDNAIVDFKYLASPKVTWWFDHHQSAFLTPEDHQDYLLYRSRHAERHGDGRPVGGKFYNPEYISCTSLIADVAREEFGFNPEPYSELIHWANIVDGAKYASAQAAIEMAEPAMKLTMVIESVAANDFVPRLIPLLTEMSLQQVLDRPFVQKELGPLMERHHAGIELLRERAVLERGVVTFDITDRVTEGYNKFIPYYLLPDAVYNVGLSRSSFRTKVAVGTNPWATLPAEELANVAAICERYGGGGHARVGAVSFPPDREDAARTAAAEIAAELRAGH
ncbi:MAG: phosphoesterase [Acidobacteriota bacterium]|nr:phosphoesterase [Acidobacteriota bacterium]